MKLTIVEDKENIEDPETLDEELEKVQITTATQIRVIIIRKIVIN